MNVDDYVTCLVSGVSVDVSHVGCIDEYVLDCLPSLCLAVLRFAWLGMTSLSFALLCFALPCFALLCCLIIAFALLRSALAVTSVVWCTWL